MRIRSLTVLALVAVLGVACNSTSASPSGNASPGTSATAGTGTPGPSGSPSSSGTPGASGTPTTSGTPAGGVSAECKAGTVQTKQDGKLTVSTDNPAFPPWFGGTVPSGSDWADFGGYPPSGEGFESAIAYAIADALGFTKDQVTWKGQSAFGLAFKPGSKDFDFHVGQVSYRPKRAEAVDFSKSYYDVSQVVIARGKDEIASVTTLAGLKDFQLGAAQNTTSLEAITEVIKPTKEPKVYADNDKAATALKQDAIDGLVVDLPTGFIIVATEMNNGQVVGQLPQLGGTQEYFGAVLEKDSPFTDCVNQAIDAIKADGAWQTIFDKWLAGKDSAPLLQ